MKLLRAGGKFFRGLGHAIGGLLTIHLRFPKMTEAERGAEVSRWAARMLVLLDIELVVKGTPCASGPMLLVSNHISWLDILVMHAARYCRFVSKSEIRHWPIIGALATGAGTLYIERASRRDAMRVVHGVADSLRAGEVVAVFPEGTTSDGITLLPFHANMLQAAISAGAPVQPIGLNYIDAATDAYSGAPNFIGDDTLAMSIWRTLSAPRLAAVLHYGEPQHAGGRDRREWAADLQETVKALRSASLVA